MASEEKKKGKTRQIRNSHLGKKKKDIRQETFGF